MLLALGSRGDIEPFLVLAQILKQDHHEVISVLPAQFQREALAMGLLSHPFTEEFLAISQTAECKLILGGSGSFFQRMRAYRKVYKSLKKVEPDLLAHEQAMISRYRPDKIIFNPLCIYSIYWSYFHPNQAIQILSFPFISHPDDQHRFLMMRGTRNRGSWINRLSYAIMNTIKAIQLKKNEKKFPINPLRHPVSIHQFKRHCLQILPSWYPISKHLFDKPRLWGDHVRIVGNLERELDPMAQVPAQLQLFLDRYDKIILVSFGSMTNDKPDHFTKMILDIAIKHRLAIVFNTASGGLIAPDDFPEHTIFIDFIPFQLILPKIYAVLHHGGTGTTHLSVKYGCVSILIPHILDQFYWAEMIYQKKLGPKGIPINKLNSDRLEKTLLEALNNKEYKVNAERISQQMKSENSSIEILKWLTLDC